MRSCLLVLCSLLAKSALRDCVAQQRQGHHHQQTVNPAGLFAQQRRDKTPRVCETPTAPCNPGLAFGGGDDRGLPPRAGADSGPQHTAGLALLVVPNRLVIRPDVGLAVPRDAREGGGGVGRPVPASRWCSRRWEDSTRGSRQRWASAVSASWATAGRGTRWAGRGKSGCSMAAASRCVALFPVTAARSRAACASPTRQRWAMPEWHNASR